MLASEHCDVGESSGSLMEVPDIPEVAANNASLNGRNVAEAVAAGECE